MFKVGVGISQIISYNTFKTLDAIVLKLEKKRLVNLDLDIQ